jgi:hypothetical protein
VWFDPPTIAEYLVRKIRNPVGEPSNLLIRRSAFPDASCLHSYAGLPIRHLIDVAFYMNAAHRGPCVAIGSYLAAFRQHAAQVSSVRQAAAFSAGVFEWEIFLRGAVHQGLVSPDLALEGVPLLDGLYRAYGSGFAEVHLLRKRLPALKEMLASGEQKVLTDQFLDDLRVADELIRMRSASAQPMAGASG